MRPRSVVLLGVCLALSGAVTPLHAQEPPRGDGWVVIPVADYRALRAKAYPDDPVPAPPPVDAALTRLAYDLTLAGDSITGTATADIDVLKDGWVEVLIPAGLLVRDARLDGRPVSLIDQPSPHVLLSKRGRSQLTLQIVLPVTPAGAAESVVVPPAPAALVEASLQIPRDGVEMTVANGFMSGQSQSAGTSRWTAYRPRERAAHVPVAPSGGGSAGRSAAAPAGQRRVARRPRRRLDAADRHRADRGPAGPGAIDHS